MDNIGSDITKGMHNMDEMKMFNIRLLGKLVGQTTPTSLLRKPWDIFSQGARMMRNMINIITSDMSRERK